MIVSCPRCRKQYRLDVSRLNYTHLPDNSGQGVQLACSNCHEQWWELKKESVNNNQSEYKFAVPEQPFRNLTDISLLYQRQSAGYAYKPAQESGSQTSTDAYTYPQQQAAKKELIKPKKWKVFIQITLWSLIILAGTVSLALVAMHYNPTLSFRPAAADTSSPVAPEEISVENIQFDVKPLDEEHQRIIVVGNVKNSGLLTVPLNNVQITAWGTCQEAQSANEQGLCEIRVWPYKWKQDLLQPGEQLTFKSAAKIPANLQVDQVHVDVATN